MAPDESGQLHAPADLHWEINAVKIRQEAGWAPERVSMLLKNGQLLLLSGFEPRTVPSAT